MRKETDYLGFTISSQGIKPNSEKVKAIRDLKTPETVREIRSFIGMSSWYRRFIPGFSEIAKPLVNLTKKYAHFKWDGACENAFNQLKKDLTRVPLLAYPDPNKPYILYTDASMDCIGACLVQRQMKT